MDKSRILSGMETHINESARVKKLLLNQSDKLFEIIAHLAKVIESGGCIYSCGNGGSSCDAMHFTEELVARYLRERPGIRAHHFSDPSILTCWANDYDYSTAFARSVSTHLTSKDVLCVLSTSGNSPNILKAMEAAKKVGASTVALLGKGGGKAKALADLEIVVESDFTANIQECHITLIHIICDQLEQHLFPSAK